MYFSKLFIFSTVNSKRIQFIIELELKVHYQSKVLFPTKKLPILDLFSSKFINGEMEIFRLAMLSSMQMLKLKTYRLVQL